MSSTGSSPSSCCRAATRSERAIGGPGYQFDDEIHGELTFNEPYVLAMANAGIQGGRGTNGSQFFITTVPTPHLQGKHTIFGEVADDESKRVVDAIEAVPTGPGDVPRRAGRDHRHRHRREVAATGARDPGRDRSVGLLPASRPQQLDALLALRPHHLPRVPDPDAVGCALPGLRARGRAARFAGSSTAAPRAAKAKKKGMRRSAIAQRVDAASRPMLTIVIAGAALVLWILGFVTNNAPSLLLDSSPALAVEVWRYVTTSLVYPAIGSQYVLSTLLGIAIFVWIGWGAERTFGWRRFGVLVLVSGIGAAAVAGIALGSSYGLIGAVWGIFGGYLIMTWDQPQVRNRLLITMAIWLLVTLFFGNIVAAIGGAGSGIGATLLLRYFDGRSGSRPSTPYLILAGGLAALILLAILSGTVVSQQA